MSTNLPPKTASDMLKTSKVAKKTETERKMQRLVGDDVMNEDDAPAESGEAILKRAADRNDKRH